ncbi:MAG: GAK system XXXCH domain-containing protein [Thermodesulfobacteriota bacterium]
MQNLSRVFCQIEKSVHINELPSFSLTKELLDYSWQIYQNAPEDWELEAEDFNHLADQLHKAVLNKDLKSAIPLIHSLKEAQQFCHASFCRHT